ncbi:MAG TPA: MBL fold metallo-hydrolase [Methanomassiliicoccales archaeon]|nr:MBL fold metallo-hydrolase [Methanomassiliicoccales archaeon]
MKSTEHVSSLHIPFKVFLPSGVGLERFVIIHIVHGERSCIIDAGVRGSEDIIMSALVAEGLPDPIGILLTHTHPDHIGAARALHDRLDIPIICPAAERNWLEDVSLQAKERPVPGFERLVGGPAPVEIEVGGGFRLDLGGVEVEAIATPGHSKGSTCYRVIEDDALVSGDAVPLTSEPPIYDDAIASLESVRRLMEMDPKRLLPAWHQPLYGPDVGKHLIAGETMILRFQEAVAAALAESPDADDESACLRTLDALGFPRTAVNPLVIRTFKAHRRVLTQWPG